uniref:RNA-directed DNA polymerase, eukaryota n=1 Tax=Tanacetum cinerariifolium TaxID=118510 RepID=A0A6L2JV11_TANCI|nr:RNA-directed DNA polymerase, eukaryota [Tanacetum cinerariifolium]
MNFPDYVDAKILWVECQSYGRIVDAFIANKRSKAEKRFGFVLFLGVKNEEQLARSLASIWIGSYHLFAYVARFNRQEKNEVFSKNNGDKTTNSIPSQKAYHVGSSQNKNSYTSSLNGDRDSKVKKQVIAVKGNMLLNVPLTPSLITCVSVCDMSRHVIGRVKDLNYIPNLRTLLTKEGFSDVKLTYLGGMLVMVELDNESLSTSRTMSHGEKNKSIGSQHGEDDLVDDSDAEGVSETFLPKGVAQDSDSSLSHPPGFTSEVSRQENDHRGVDLNTKTDKVNLPLVHMKVINNSHKVHKNVTSNGESAFNYSHNAYNGGLILEVLDDMIRVVKDVFKDHFATRLKQLAHGRLKLNISFPNRLSTDQFADMDRSISRDEIRVVVWNCGENKSPGPDGATSDGLFKGIQIQGSMDISHLFYADDVVFIGEWSDSNLDNIVKILKCFFLASGVKINIQKSQVLGVGVPRNIINQAALLIGCAVMQNPFRYLGVMVRDSMSQKLAWADMVQKLRFDFVSHCKKRVGDGHNTLFWYDSCVFDQPLRVRFPRLFALETDKESMVALKLGSSLVDAFFEDRFMIELSDSKVCNILDNIFLPSAADATRWVKYIPIKINVFAWRARLDRLATRSNLVRRGVVLDSSLCPLCGLVLEDIHHVLFRCDTTKLVFRRICRWYSLVEYMAGETNGFSVTMIKN